MCCLHPVNAYEACLFMPSLHHSHQRSSSVHWLSCNQQWRVSGRWWQTQTGGRASCKHELTPLPRSVPH